MLRLIPTVRKRTALLCALAASIALPTAHAQTPPHSPTALAKAAARGLSLPVARSKNTLSVSVTAIDADAVHAALADGTSVDAAVKHGSAFLVNGRLVAPGEFPVGGQAWLRTRTRASDGALSVVLLCDTASETALDMYRKQVLVGHVVGVDDKTLVVQPDGDQGRAVVSLRLTPKTVFRHGGAESAAPAFPADASVAVQARSLPSGLLMALVVSDSAADLAGTKAARKTTSLSGSAGWVDLDKQQLRITPKTKPGQVVAVAQNTRIKVRKLDGTLKDITVGMHVSARLSAQKDGEGHPVAVSLAAYDAPVPLVKKKAVAVKKAP